MNGKECKFTKGTLSLVTDQVVFDIHQMSVKLSGL